MARLSREESLARRRLNAVLADEQYGPKLARLKGDAERRVLDLIEQGKGREARKAILEEDEARKAAARSGGIAKQAITNMMKQHGGRARYTKIVMHVNNMTREEKRFAAAASRQQLADAAVDKSKERIIRETGETANVFWYH